MDPNFQKTNQHFEKMDRSFYKMDPHSIPKDWEYFIACGFFKVGATSPGEVKRQLLKWSAANQGLADEGAWDDIGTNYQALADKYRNASDNPDYLKQVTDYINSADYRALADKYRRLGIPVNYISRMGP